MVKGCIATRPRLGTINLFIKIIGDFEKIFNINNTTYERLLFKNEKNYNKDLVFIILFLSFAQLYTEHYEINDYFAMSNAVENIADKELSEIINTSECEWNTEIRNRLIDRVKNVLIKIWILKKIIQNGIKIF